MYSQIISRIFFLFQVVVLDTTEQIFTREVKNNVFEFTVSHACDIKQDS